ncbi:ROK family transcriptional regulator [uncultured Microbacterium sp.]|uniref:ROK family transcriptional regulator n=1 Tax=uncultured Microbacterium sp. TaxID=191216 RepID=UPI0025ECB8CC|nr:ROK family transcriptional regulator [uncultured Microbacterium sp.]
MGWQPSDQLTQDVALEVLLHGPLGRAELARRLDLAPATLTRISSELIRSGIVTETSQVIEGRGRPTTPLDVVPTAHHFLGVKLAGEFVFAVVTDLRARVVRVLDARHHTGSPEEVVDIIHSLRDEAEADHPIDAVGIAVGGVVDADGAITSAPFLGWTDIPLAAMTERQLQRPTACANDLEAFVEALHWFGVGSGHSNFAAITLGVGVGYGCIANGRVLANADSGVGLVGHWPLDPLGPLCRKGHQGCAEAMLTIPAIKRSMLVATGEQLDWDQIIARARRGDDTITRLLERSGRALGQLIAAVANLTAPDFIVIGGEGVDLAEVARADLLDGLDEHRDPRASKVSIELAPGTNEEWCRGAAVLGIRRFVLARGNANNNPLRAETPATDPTPAPEARAAANQA